MGTEKIQWTILGVVVVGLVVFGGFIMQQNARLARVSDSLSVLSANVQNLSQREMSQIPRAPATAPPSATQPAPPTAQTAPRHTDTKTGISFIVPSNWIVGSDEGGNLNIIKADPYSTVSFEVVPGRAVWQTRVNNLSGVNSDDTLIANDTMTIGGFTANRRIYQRNIGGGSSFQYGKYFVDGGTKWYEISTSDPSSDITQVLQSIRF